jgi:hypothetical protein
MHATTLLLPLALAFSLVLSSPLSLTKRWTCGGVAPAFSCEPAAGCKSETTWGECALAGLEKCAPDPTPSQTVPVRITLESDGRLQL